MGATHLKPVPIQRSSSRLDPFCVADLFLWTRFAEFTHEGFCGGYADARGVHFFDGCIVSLTGKPECDASRQKHKEAEFHHVQ